MPHAGPAKTGSLPALLDSSVVPLNKKKGKPMRIDSLPSASLRCPVLLILQRRLQALDDPAALTRL